MSVFIYNFIQTPVYILLEMPEHQFDTTSFHLRVLARGLGLHFK